MPQRWGRARTCIRWGQCSGFCWTIAAQAEETQQRYGSVEELANDVAHYLNGFPVSAYPEGLPARLWRWVVKNSAWILLIVAYLVMRALFVVWRGR